MLNLAKHLTLDDDLIYSSNLAKEFDEKDQKAIAHLVWEGYRKDKESRLPWEKRMQAAMDLAMQVSKAKNWPWPGCSNVIFPLITIASLQFSARSYAHLIQGTNVVRYRTIGTVDTAALERANRIGRHMSWQVLEEDEAWEEQKDRQLINLAIVGCNFTKTYFDRAKGYPVGVLVMAKDLIIDYYATSVEAAARKTHRFSLSRNELRERMLRKVFCDCTEEAWFKAAPASDQGDPDRDRRLGQTPPTSDQDTPFWVLEQHRWLDLDGDGYEEPYIVTIEESSHTLLRIVARWETMDEVEFNEKGKVVKIKATEYFQKYSFIPSPDGGIYDLGFGVFLGPINEAVNSAINQMLDFATMQVSIGGLLGRGAKIRGGVYTMAPWEFKRVDSSGDDLKKSIYMWPERQAPDFLMKLVMLLIEYSNRIAGTVDATVGENPGQNTPASTFQGMTEQGMQVYKMIFKRIWRSLKGEFKQRYAINRWALDDKQSFGNAQDFVRREDYTGNPDQVAPVANPNVSSAMMKIQTSLAVKQSAMTTPGYDLYEVEKQYLETLEAEAIDVIYPGPGKVKQENMLPPNPKAVQAQLKLQEVQLKLQDEKQRWIFEMMQEKRVNDAKILLMRAQAAAALADANEKNAATKLEAFNQLIEVYEKHNEMLEQRIGSLLGEGGKGGQDSDGTGVSELERKPGDEGDSGVSISVPGGSSVSVGNGDAKR